VEVFSKMEVWELGGGKKVVVQGIDAMVRLPKGNEACLGGRGKDRRPEYPHKKKKRKTK